MSQYRISGASAASIAGDVEAAVRDGRLPPGCPLPSVRRLASDLGVSPTTTAAAYRLLRQRGLAVGQGRRGTRVTGRPPVSLPGSFAGAPAGVRDLGSGSPDPALLPRLDLVLGAAGFPGEWAEVRLYGESRDHRPLVDRMTRQLAEDGVSGAPVAVVGGAMDGVERCLAAYLQPGDKVALEDPGYASVIDLLAAMRLVPAPVAIDDDGPDPAALARALAEGARAVVVTPRAQNPTGAALSPERAADLRSILAERPEVLLIEDDHAGPVAGGPVSLISAAPGTGTGRWAVVRSVSKWLGPDLRVAFVAGDETTIGRVEGRHALGPGWVSHVSQRLALSLWEQATSGEAVDGEPGELSGLTLLSRAAATYSARRRALVADLAERGIPAHGRSGLNVWIPVRDESGTARALLERGWAVRPGERYRLRSGPAVRITTAALALEDVGALAADVADLVAGRPRTAGRTLTA